METFAKKPKNNAENTKQDGGTPKNYGSASWKRYEGRLQALRHDTEKKYQETPTVDPVELPDIFSSIVSQYDEAQVDPLGKFEIPGELDAVAKSYQEGGITSEDILNGLRTLPDDFNLIRFLHSEAAMKIFAGYSGANKEVGELIKRFTKDRDNYFIRTSFQHLGQRVGGEVVIRNNENEELFYEITGGVWALREKGVRLVPQDQKDLLERYVEDNQYFRTTPRVSYEEDMTEAAWDHEERIENLNDSSLLMHETLDHGVVLQDYMKTFGVSEIDISDFMAMQLGPIREQVELDLGINLREFPVIEQYYIFENIKSYNEEFISNLKSFVELFGSDGLRAFLVYEHDEHDHSIIDYLYQNKKEYGLSHSLDILESYGEIIDQSYKTEEELRALFPEASTDQIQTIAYRTRKRAAKSLTNGLVSGDIHKIQTKNVLLLESFKEFKRQGVIGDITDFENITLRQQSGPEATTKEIASMGLIYQSNFAGYSAEFRNELLNRFKLKLENSNTKIQSISFEDETVAFLAAVEDIENKTVEISAFNANPDYAEVGPGGVLIHNIVNRYAEDGWKVIADAPLKNARTYTTNYGFVGTGKLEFAGEELLLIERDDSVKYETKDRKEYSRKKIRELAELGIPDEKGNIAIHTTLDEKEFPPQLEQGYVITQSFIDNKNERIYFLLEKRF